MLPEPELSRKKNFTILTLILLAYLVFNAFLLFGHEMWRDEANVWLMARDLSPFALFREIKYQGHPCLWYLLVMPFAKLHLPFATIGFLSYGIMGFAGGLFVYRGPFHPLVKFALLFSPAFSYYYPVIARNYCLIALLLMLLAYYYPKRNDKPVIYGLLIALLVQADVIAFAAAGMIWLWWVVETVIGVVKRRKEGGQSSEGSKDLSGSGKIRFFVGILLPVLSLILLALEFRGVSGSSEFHPNELVSAELPLQIKNGLASVIGRMTGLSTTVALALFVFMVAVALMLSLERRKVFPLLVLVSSFLYEVIFSLVIYQLHIWHYLALVFVMIWTFWRLMEPEDSGSEAKSLGSVLFVMFSFLMFLRWNDPEEGSSLANALKGVYSDGKNVAACMRETVDPDALIFSTDVAECSTVLAYLPRKYSFVYAGSMKEASYADYNEEQKQTVSYPELLDHVRNAYPGTERFYILKSKDQCITDLWDYVDGFEVIYETPCETARGEEYSLYSVLVP